MQFSNLAFLMKRSFTFLVCLALFCLSLNTSFGQSAPFCPTINSQVSTGPTTVICNGQCANLTASVVPVNLTTTYSVGPTAYSPFSFSTGTSILANQDDIWSSTINIGFPFCYYGNTFNQCKVSSNGQLTFSLAVPSTLGGNNWQITAAIPSLVNMPGNTICAAFRDIDPTSSGNIYFASYGVAPCRSFVVSWNNIPMYDNPGSCTGIPNSTFQLVLHETTNYIDVFIQNSTSCAGWNSGRGIIGIQNVNATLATSPPLRNFPTAWTAVNEAWRFAPTGAPTYTVTWTGPTGIVGTGLTATVCPSATSNYTATMNVSACAGANSTYTSALTVSVVPGPTLAVTSTSICQGATGTLTASGATTYTWVTGGTSGTTASYSPLATTVYTVLGSTGAACISQGTGTVFITPSPTPNITSNSPVCIGAPINFTGSGGITYLWVGPSSFNSSNANPNIPVSAMANNGTYTLTVTDANGCSTTTTTPVTVNSLPIVAATGSSICINQTINLSANGGVSYLWSGPNGFISNLQNPTIAAATAAMTGVYNVTVTAATSCKNTGSANVIVNPPPTPTLSTNSPVCINSTLSFFANGGVSYSWLGPNGFASGSQNPNLTATTTNFSGTYTVFVSDAIGCTASAVITAIVNPLPLVAISMGNNKACVPLCTSFTVMSSSGTQNCQWQLGDGVTLSGSSINYCYSTAGDFVITATLKDANGCTNLATASATAYPLPVADFNYAPIKPIFEEPIQFTDATYAANVTSWNWYFMADGSFTSNEQNPNFTYPQFGVFSIALVVKSDFGCIDTIIKNIEVLEDFGLYVPDAFTPNGDGINDVFSPKGFGITDYEMEIYDRWGEKLFRTKDMHNGWDGKYQGKSSKVLQDGTYVWRIRLMDVYGKSKELTGHVTLIK